MSQDAWTYDELFEGLDPAPNFVKELERLGLLRVVAEDARGRSLYGAEAREQLDKVLALIELGYAAEDIAAIAKKVGLPSGRRGRFKKRPVYLRLSALAAQTELEVSVLEQWLDLGLIEADFQSDGGEVLFRESEVLHVKQLTSFLTLGFTISDAASWRRIDRAMERLAAEPEELAVADALLSEAAEFLQRVQGRLRRLKAGHRVWDKVHHQATRRLERLNRLAGLRPRRSQRSR